MTKLPSEAEPVLVRIVSDPDQIPIIKIQKDRRRWPIIVRAAAGALLVILGFAIGQRTSDQTPARYMMGHAVDAAEAADLPLYPAELHLNGWQPIPTYPPPSKGKESDRIAADAALITVEATAVQVEATYAVGFGLAIALAGLTLLVSALLQLTDIFYPATLSAILAGRHSLDTTEPRAGGTPGLSAGRGQSVAMSPTAVAGIHGGVAKRR